MAGRRVKADLLPVGYFHVVFTVPPRSARHRIAKQASRLRICCSGKRRDPCAPSAADPPPSRPRASASPPWLHSWGSAADASSAPPHDRCPAAAFSLGRTNAGVSSRPGLSACRCGSFSKLFRRLFLTRLLELHARRKSFNFFGRRTQSLSEKTASSQRPHRPGLRRKELGGLRQAHHLPGPEGRCLAYSGAAQPSGRDLKPPG